MNGHVTQIKPSIVLKKLKKYSLLAVFCLGLLGCSGNPSKPNIDAAKTTPASDRAMLHTRLAREYMGENQLATAQGELEKALRLSPNHSDSNYVMGLLMIKLNNLKDAEYYLERSVKSNRENSSAAHDFGMLLCQTGKERRSVEYFEIAASNPLFKRAELSYMRAGECLDRIDDGRAEAFLKKALSYNSKLRPALFRLAMLKKKNGQNLNARAYIERYLAITKPQPDALLLAYEIESSLRADDVAETYRKKLLENFPGSKQAEKLRSAERAN